MGASGASRQCDFAWLTSAGDITRNQDHRRLSSQDINQGHPLEATLRLTYERQTRPAAVAGGDVGGRGARNQDPVVDIRVCPSPLSTRNVGSDPRPPTGHLQLHHICLAKHLAQDASEFLGGGRPRSRRAGSRPPPVRMRSVDHPATRPACQPRHGSIQPSPSDHWRCKSRCPPPPSPYLPAQHH